MRTIIIILLIIHSAASLWSLRDSGFFAPFPPFSEDYVYQIFSDLGVALSIGILFIFVEVRRHRKPLNGFVIMLVMTLIVGSFSPLAYLILNPEFLQTSRIKE